MSARLHTPTMLDLGAIVAAADRILSRPTTNVQRVSLDETYSFARLAKQFVALAGLAALHQAGAATPADTATLTAMLQHAGFLPAPTQRPTTMETSP